MKPVSRLAIESEQAINHIFPAKPSPDTVRSHSETSSWTIQETSTHQKLRRKTAPRGRDHVNGKNPNNVHLLTEPAARNQFPLLTNQKKR